MSAGMIKEIKKMTVDWFGLSSQNADISSFNFKAHSKKETITLYL